ncbi:MAG: CBS domain-containing protein [Litorilituus sp.]|jgi:acetoin utilization protein AcuB|nr:CBS domain-containing protein [Litorilituus sp.]
MSINALMSRDLVTIDLDDTLATIREIFEQVTFHHILVIENKKLVGVVSDRDFFKSVGPRLGTSIETERDKLPLNRKVHQVMNRKLICVNEQASVIDVVNCFHNNRVSCVPVIDNNGCPIGIISWRDIVDALAKKMMKNSTPVSRC